ncbi:MAG: 16S rRNA (cytosine(967)-C(5))-methyltransferase RsmB [Oscillospiraceae bacterium]|jgi:16S rRNA (cytosine967-C5)-methyltransferase|nr:16S rRNA (cytosine(967)-C(5))-methyltransferase RsmB [Oscillospiraceae bacterium]
MAPTAREVALNCLLAGERQGAWSDGYLRNAIRKAGLDRRDAAFCTRLAFGVLQNRMYLDWHIARLSKTPLDKLEPPVRNCLRLGIYQLLLLDRVPVHAAVNESVSLTKKYSRNPRSGALVNAILRTVDRTREDLPQPKDISVRYSHPDWLVKEFSHTLSGEELESLLAANNAQPPTQIQVNTQKVTTQELIEELTQAGISALAHPWLPDCLELEGTGSLEDLPAFREGRFYVQDAAARLAVLASGAAPGMDVLDTCAAPGGKSFAAAIQMEGKGYILSCDLHPHKKRLIEDGASRLGVDCITAAVMDGRKFDPALEGRFDLVITDVPCSGLGIIRKKPDIRYKDPVPLAALPEIQRDILSNSSRYVRPGGILLYATCTLLPRENEDVVGWFLDKNNSFTLESFTLPDPLGGVETGMLTLWPHRHGTDGFFIARLRRKG